MRKFKIILFSFMMLFGTQVFASVSVKSAEFINQKAIVATSSTKVTIDEIVFVDSFTCTVSYSIDNGKGTTVKGKVTADTCAEAGALIAFIASFL
jgi:hypothetical protein